MFGATSVASVGPPGDLSVDGSLGDLCLDEIEEGVDDAVDRDSLVEARRSRLTAGVLYPSFDDMKDASSRGTGKGAEQSVAAKAAGRPVITDNVRSVTAIAHQTRYRISLDESAKLRSSLRRLRPNVKACLMATPLMAEALLPSQQAAKSSTAATLPVYLVRRHEIEACQAGHLDSLQLSMHPEHVGT